MPVPAQLPAQPLTRLDTLLGASGLRSQQLRFSRVVLTRGEFHHLTWSLDPCPYTSMRRGVAPICSSVMAATLPTWPLSPGHMAV